MQPPRKRTTKTGPARILLIHSKTGSLAWLDCDGVRPTPAASSHEFGFVIFNFRFVFRVRRCSFGAPCPCCLSLPLFFLGLLLLDAFGLGSSARFRLTRSMIERSLPLRFGRFAPFFRGTQIGCHHVSGHRPTKPPIDGQPCDLERLRAGLMTTRDCDSGSLRGSGVGLAPRSLIRFRRDDLATKRAGPDPVGPRVSAATQRDRV